ncbi:DUF2518 family protein [Synechococcus sp. CCAP 1479/9]|uniref:DUF2518 family protein n=1 Tax=Synechococcus sp. CCAP 1479/9 TaxID=1221593 RepID=UPI001C22C249|nr:DUF2518 family protein [Synechococcus sp. CCAP 1479/9]
MAADPILLVAGTWLGAASGVLAVLTIAGFLARWGIRFRLVGITSFTALLALSCLAFSISYNPRVSVPGAIQVPVVFDNGTDLVIAAAPTSLEAEAVAPTLDQVARNLRGGGRGSGGEVRVRLRRVEAVEPGLARPVVLAETTRDLAARSLGDAA